MPEELVLMSYLDVMISMDSANMHMASLVHTPVISIWENNFHGKDKMDKDLRGEYVLICEEFYYFSRLSPLDIPDGMRPNIPKVQTSYGVITKDAAEFINYVKQHVELCKYTDAK